MQFYPAGNPRDAALAIAGGPAVNPRSVGFDTFAYLSTTAFSYSDVYSDRGELREFKLDASAAAAEAVTVVAGAVNATRPPAPEMFYGLGVEEYQHMQQDWLVEGSLRNDIVITGEYSGDGLAWYEVVVDGPDTIRWRVSHGHVNSSGAWAETFLPMPTDDHLTRGTIQMVGGDDGMGAGAGDVQSDEVPETVVLSHGLSIRYLRRGAHHILGDRWTFRVYGGKPMVTGAVTPHNEPQFSARGPFEGNSEITVLGNSFFPGANLRCRLFDADTNSTMTLQGYYDSMRQVRCITKRIDPRPGGELVATIRPCVFKTLQVSHNGGTTWSAASANVQFLFCDIYVSTTGSDVAGYGTPDRPYATLQRGIEAALGKPRAYYSYAPKDFTSVRHPISLGFFAYRVDCLREILTPVHFSCTCRRKSAGPPCSRRPGLA